LIIDPLFADLFAFPRPARVNFVGGGGKTALILRLAEELAREAQVLYTTTTRMHPPPLAEGRVFLTCDDAGLLDLALEAVARRGPGSIRAVAVAAALASPGLYRGVSADLGRRLDPGLFPIVLNEADGARSISLKFPRAGEPVLLDGAGVLVPVVGLDCLGRPLGPASLFRWELARDRFGLVEGEPITPALAARVLLAPDGVCKGWAPPVEVVPFINKVDTEADEQAALELARALLDAAGPFPIRRVVWGSVERLRAGSVAR
jgi:probable selenium-dependent hydroxylase accessory protein YqeC